MQYLTRGPESQIAASQAICTPALACVQGGDFIQMTKTMTGAKVGVDKPIGVFDERLVHVSGFDE